MVRQQSQIDVVHFDLLQFGSHKWGHTVQDNDPSKRDKTLIKRLDEMISDKIQYWLNQIGGNEDIICGQSLCRSCIEL